MAQKSFKLTQLQTHHEFGGGKRDSPNGSSRSPASRHSSPKGTARRSNGSPRRTRGSQYSKDSLEDRDAFDEESMTSDEDEEFHIEDFLTDSMSPGLRMKTDYDMPQLRDK